MREFNQPTGYLGQTRRIGAKKWDTVTGYCKTKESALSLAAKKMKGMFRLRVIYCGSVWYGPNVVFEGKFT